MKRGSIFRLLVGVIFVAIFMSMLAPSAPTSTDTGLGDSNNNHAATTTNDNDESTEAFGDSNNNHVITTTEEKHLETGAEDKNLKEESEDDTLQNPVVAPISVKIDGVAHLYCFFHSTSQSTIAYRVIEGSGVVFDTSGLVLTARHVVDPSFTANFYPKSLSDHERALYKNLAFDYCEVGLPADRGIPGEIVADMDRPYKYVANKIVFSPSSLSLNDQYAEMHADFAVIQITSINQEFAKSYNNIQFPSSFPANKLLKEIITTNSDVVSYSYPAYNQGGNIDSFITLKRFYTSIAKSASFGEVSFYEIKKSNTWNGSSGSPIFWNGYVVGILFAGDITSGNDVVVSSKTIVDFSGLGR